MSRSFVYKSLFFICLSAILFYRYLDRQNAVTMARLELPKMSHELKAIEEENALLRYTIQALENPERLIELSRQQEFSHLKYPYLCEVVRLPKREPLIAKARTEEKSKKTFRLKPSFVIGAKS
jgi:hypothetical protein